MNDLIGAHARLHEIFRLYVESAFPFRYPALDQERRAILGTNGTLSQEVLVEPMAVYPSSGYTLEKAAEELGTDYNGLATLGAGLLPAEIKIYKHQWQSLEAVVRRKKDLVVTTGTGSGKTECFLLPLLASLARESANWKACNENPNRFWWRNGMGRIGQWGHSQRPHAMRALVLYPLNALVEDQLRRLRMTLDSPEVHRWLDENRGGNRILFGRYTGHTPVAGMPEKDRVRKLKQWLQLSDKAWSKVGKALAQENADPEIRYHFARIDGGEMWSRWDMQETPPDILITNYSMLNIMLMRDVEEQIFSQTREWLAASDDNVFHLVVDELHSYRGTPGTEVAYILRLFLDRLGLTPDSAKLRILTTTASMDESEESRQFLKEFFGRNDRFEVIAEKQVSPPANAALKAKKYANAFADFAENVLGNPLEIMAPSNLETPQAKQATLALAEVLGVTPEPNDPPAQTLAKGLEKAGIINAFRDACRNSDGMIRATRLSVLNKVLFGVNDDHPSTAKSLRGMLSAMATAQTPARLAPQPMRGHFFFHNLENLWICSNPSCTDPACDNAVRQGNGPKPACGTLHVSHRMTCSCGGRVLDLVTCSCCGEVFLGGYSKAIKLGPQTAWMLTPDQPNLEGLPDNNSDGRRYGNYAIFLPCQEELIYNKAYQHKGNNHHWDNAVLDPCTGIVRCQAAIGLAAGAVSGRLFRITGNTADKASAFPPKCPRCDTDFRRGSAGSPLRQHRTGFQRASQVIASALAREMPELMGGRKSRKLVIFSDSRQDAAKLSAGMELDHFRDMVRVCLIGAHEEATKTFVAAVKKYVRGDHALVMVANINPVLGGVLEKHDVSDNDLAKAFHQRCKDATISMRDVSDEDADDFTSELKDLIWGYPSKVPLPHIRDIVWNRLLALGICPGGTRAESLEFDDGGEWKDWWECFEWKDSGPRLKQGMTPGEQNHIVTMKQALMKELVLCLFPHKTRTFERLGLGYATCRVPREAGDSLLQACLVLIRYLCERKEFRYWQTFTLAPQGAPQGLPTPFASYLRHIGIEEGKLVQTLQDAGVLLNGTHSLGIDSDRLWLEILSPSEKQKAMGWACPSCGAFYMHRAAGFCIECIDHSIRLEETPVQASLDYYRYLAEKAGKGFRFHSEELTGQTDDADKPNRQRWFQEVFIADENEIPAIHGIDLLSVTTTMEAGVDIGSLLAVMMANMPPRRFNYQQRVGRAGRRGTGLSLAVTFCRGRSHDEFYYHRPEAITGDPPPTPYIDVRQPEILRRVLAKEVLRMAFIDAEKNGLTARSPSESVHGQFGLAGNWETIKPAIQKFLCSDAGKKVARKTIASLSFGMDPEAVEARMMPLLKYAQKQLLDEVDAAVQDPHLTQDALSERLAASGILPMFGFPTRSRNLFTKVPRRGLPWPPPNGVVNRDLDIALSQFAPGSETVKDKRVYTAAGVADFFPTGQQVGVRPGFTPPLEDDQGLPVGNVRIGICHSCQAVQYVGTENTPPPGETLPPTLQCPVCREQNMPAVDAREPRDFFCTQSNDFEGKFEWVPRSTRPMLCASTQEMTPIEGTNTTLHSSSTEIISINDNGGEGGFDFHKVSLMGVKGGGAYAVNPYFTRGQNIQGSSHRIALLSRRHTDVMIADFAQWPDGLYADPKSVPGRAAWYSFAFLLRIAAATLLDIDVQELQAGIRTLNQNGVPRGQAFLSDTLENGAGYCRWLAKPGNFHKLLSLATEFSGNGIGAGLLAKDHASTCDTSCNHCLRDFYNMQYHGLLDWRLALDMARLAMNANAIMDLNTPLHQEIPNVWNPLVHDPSSPISRTLAQLGYQHKISENQLPYYYAKTRNKALIAAHPLWTLQKPEYLAAHREIVETYKGCIIEPMNLFMAIRRPADCI